MRGVRTIEGAEGSEIGILASAWCRSELACFAEERGGDPFGELDANGRVPELPTCSRPVELQRPSAASRGRLDRKSGNAEERSLVPIVFSGRGAASGRAAASAGRGRARLFCAKPRLRPPAVRGPSWRTEVAQGQPHCGIVRLVGFSARAQGVVCVDVLARYGSDLASAAIVTVEPGTVRIRTADP
jgi:hypothetical protein